jgi:hypothetical protein
MARPRKRRGSRRVRDVTAEVDQHAQGNPAVLFTESLPPHPAHACSPDLENACGRPDGLSRVEEKIMTSTTTNTVEALEGMRILPPPVSSRLIDFTRAEVRPGIVNGTFVLIVAGEAPSVSMRVELVPLVYVQRPDFWEIEVVGRVSGPVWLPATKPYVEALPLDGITGAQGIEVVGATRRQRIRVP